MRKSEQEIATTPPAKITATAATALQPHLLNINNSNTHINCYRNLQQQQKSNSYYNNSNSNSNHSTCINKGTAGKICATATTIPTHMTRATAAAALIKQQQQQLL